MICKYCGLDHAIVGDKKADALQLAITALEAAMRANTLPGFWDAIDTALLEVGVSLELAEFEPYGDLRTVGIQQRLKRLATHTKQA